MKKIAILLFSTCASTMLFAQTYSRHIKSSASDPAIQDLAITAANGETINTDLLATNLPVKLQFTVLNNDAQTAIPAGSCRIMLSLGTKFTMLSNINNQQALPLNNYFKWKLSQATDSRQYVLYGFLYRDLPAGFSSKVSFNLVPSKAGSSTVVCQLMVSNEKNPNNILSDNNPNNNNVSLAYTNLKSPEIKFTAFSAVSRLCLLDVKWAIEDKKAEAKEFVIETSNDNGLSFQPAYTLSATGGASFGYLLEKAFKAAVTVRVKAVSENGLYVYSDNITKNDICNTAFEIAVAPNPVPAQVTEVVLVAKAGIFNGKYVVSIINAAGAEVKQLSISTSNQTNVKITTGQISPGVYFIKLADENGKSAVAKLVKQ